MNQDTNDQLILVCGMSASGKSASLQNIRNQEDWLYLNCEAGKRLPFRNKFRDGGYRIEEPYQIHEAFDVGTSDPSCKGIIVDTTTFMMDMFETQYVLNAANTMKAWGDYAQFFKILMQEKVVRFGKPVVMLAHVLDVLDEKNMEMKTSVPVKGSLKNQGIEAYFSTVVYAKRMAVKDLKDYRTGNSLLNVTPEDEALGFKHVFQTRLTKNTVGERIRSPMGMFSKEETFMDNDSQLLLDHLDKYYN